MSNRNSTYVTQTDLGINLGLTAIAVGKLLTSLGLKQGATATSKALNDRLATRCHMDAGIEYIRWHRSRVGAMLREIAPSPTAAGKRKARIAKYVRRVRGVMRDAEIRLRLGHDTEARWMYGAAYDNVPRDIVADVRASIERTEKSV